MARCPNSRILIIAGPNGAGKITFAKEFLINDAQVSTFVNADLIAAGLNPFEPERGAVQAGSADAEDDSRCGRHGESFAFH